VTSRSSVLEAGSMTRHSRSLSSAEQVDGLAQSWRVRGPGNTSDRNAQARAIV
jgi:hypothetical protein